MIKSNIYLETKKQHYKNYIWRHYFTCVSASGLILLWNENIQEYI